MEEIHGWMAKKGSVQIAGTEFYVISYAGLVFANNIVYSIWSGFSFGKSVSSNGSVSSPNKHSQDLLLLLDGDYGKNRLLMEKTKQRLIIEVSFMFIHFPA